GRVLDGPRPGEGRPPGVRWRPRAWRTWRPPGLAYIVRDVRGHRRRRAGREVRWATRRPYPANSPSEITWPGTGSLRSPPPVGRPVSTAPSPSGTRPAAPPRAARPPPPRRRAGRRRGVPGAGRPARADRRPQDRHHAQAIRAGTREAEARRGRHSLRTGAGLPDCASAMTLPPVAAPRRRGRKVLILIIVL